MKLLDSIGLDTKNSPPMSVQPGTEEQSTNPEYKAQLRRLKKFSATGQPIQPMQASVRSTRSAILKHSKWEQPNQLQKPVGEHELALELRQINGLRFWQFMRSGDDHFTGLPSSPLKTNIETNQRLQYRLGIRSGQSIQKNSRVVGHYRTPLSLARNFDSVLIEFDQKYVQDEQLVSINSDGQTDILNAREIRVLSRQISRSSNKRILILLHGAFSSTQMMIQSLGSSFIRQASRHYLSVIGFDHASLHNSARENAEHLADHSCDYSRQRTIQVEESTWPTASILSEWVEAG